LVGLTPTEDPLGPAISSRSRIVVTGQIACGKSTLATRLADRFGLTHIGVDQFNQRADRDSELSSAVAAVESGWVVDGCVWQISAAVWEAADLAFWLDYSNGVHFRRLARRAVGRCIRNARPSNVRTVLREEYGHFQIMYRFADQNRANWAEAGGITTAHVEVIRLARPRDTRTLLSSMTARGA
jgi:adenylate kinase family enzyme